MSIRKISDALGLSTTTVSWILSGQGEKRGFKKETIARVYNYAKSIDYQPNLIARNLSNGFTKTIGVIVPFINDTYYANIVQAFETEANKRSYHLSICSTEGNEDREAEIINNMLGQRVDGIILAPTKHSDKNIKLLQKKNLPFVLIDRFFDEIDTNYITIDFFKCSYNITKKLINKGAKEIAFITSDSYLCEIKNREYGYHTALKEANLRSDNNLKADITRKNYGEDFDHKFDTLLKNNPNLDGLFFATHYLAIEAFRYFIDRKIDFNNKFKIACIHSDVSHKLICPKIVIANIETSSISSKAIDLLCKNIKNRSMNTEHIILNAKII